MLRFGNIKAPAKDSGEPLVTVQKKGFKLSLGAISLLNLKPGDYVDVGQEDNELYIARTGEEEPDGENVTKPTGRKLSKSNVISSNSIRGVMSNVAETFRITNDTMSAFDLTWYKMAPISQDTVTSSEGDQADHNIGVESGDPDDDENENAELEESL